MSEELELRLGQSLVGFIDVLGASHMSNDVDFLSRLKWFTSTFKQMITTWPLGARSGARVFLFSDNVGIFVPIEDENSETTASLVRQALMVTSAFQYQFLLRHSLLCRGAFTLGPAYADDEMLFGPALVEAVMLEKAAGNPLVLLSDGVEAIARRAGVSLTEQQTLLEPFEGAQAAAVDYLASEYIASDADDLQTAFARGCATAGHAISKWEHASEAYTAFETHRAGE